MVPEDLAVQALMNDLWTDFAKTGFVLAATTTIPAAFLPRLGKGSLRTPTPGEVEPKARPFTPAGKEFFAVDEDGVHVKTGYYQYPSSSSRLQDFPPALLGGT